MLASRAERFRAAVEVSARRRVRVVVVGAIPTALCCTVDKFGVCGIDVEAEQPRDYPRDVLDNNARAAVLVAQLLHDYGDEVRPIVVDTMSPRGLWLSLRHRLRCQLAVVVGGRVVPPEVEAVRAALGPPPAAHESS